MILSDIKKSANVALDKNNDEASFVQLKQCRTFIIMHALMGLGPFNRDPCDGGVWTHGGHCCWCQLSDWNHLHPAGSGYGGRREERKERFCSFYHSVSLDKDHLFLLSL